MSDPATADGSARQIASVIGGLIVAAAVIVMLTWYVAGIFLASNPDDPLAKAGGLSKEQQIKITPK
jgi:cytochrome bd-type quinol oxidase subunit 2